MAYRDEGHGTPILLIHGWGVSGDLFEAPINGLSGKYRVLAPDLCGHGASDAFSPDAPFSSFADGIAGLIAELGLEKLCLVGWSMGAMVAWDLLLRHAGLDIAGLATIDMVPRLLNGPVWRHGLRDGDDVHVFEGNIEAMHKDWSAYTELYVPRLFSSVGSARTPELVDRARKVALANDPRNLAHIWVRMAELDFRTELQHINLPTLVVTGRHSQLYSVSAGEWVAAHMPQARTVVFPHSGHAPHMEEPQFFNRVLSEFVDSLNANQGTQVKRPALPGNESY